MARALILVRPSPAGGYVANARCNKHRATRATGPTPEAAVRAVRAAHRLRCPCGWVDVAPVRVAQETPGGADPAGIAGPVGTCAPASRPGGGGVA